MPPARHRWIGLAFDAGTCVVCHALGFRGGGDATRRKPNNMYKDWNHLALFYYTRGFSKQFFRHGIEIMQSSVLRRTIPVTTLTSLGLTREGLRWMDVSTTVTTAGRRRENGCPMRRRSELKKWAHLDDVATQETRVPAPSNDAGWNYSSPPRDGRRGCEAGAPTRA